MRFALPAARTATPIEATAPRPTNQRAGSPAAHSRPTTMASMIMPVPRSRPCSTSPTSSMPKGKMSGMAAWKGLWMTRLLAARTAAPKTTSATLPNSEGCSEKPPMEIQLRLPWKPMPRGVKTATCRASARKTPGHASLFHMLTGSREPMTASTMPTEPKTSWLRKTV